MHTIKNAVSIFSLFLCFFPASAQNRSAPADARWVITKSIQAMGGEQVLRSVKTLYTEMSTEMDGRPVTWVTKEMSPNKGAFQIVYQNRVVYEDWFNGQQGFERVNGAVKESDPESLVDKFSRKHILNELDYLDTSLYKIEMLPDTKIGNIECYKVKALFITGAERHLYIDKQKFNTIKEERLKSSEAEVSSTTYFSDFKKFGELLFYGTLIIGEGADAQKGKVNKLLINEGVSEGDFNKH